MNANAHSCSVCKGCRDLILPIPVIPLLQLHDHAVPEIYHSRAGEQSSSLLFMRADVWRGPNCSRAVQKLHLNATSDYSVNDVPCLYLKVRSQKAYLFESNGNHSIRHIQTYQVRREIYDHFDPRCVSQPSFQPTMAGTAIILKAFEGDGIGAEVAESVKTVFKADNVPIEWEQIDVTGVESGDKHSEELFRESIASLKRNKLGLKGQS